MPCSIINNYRHRGMLMTKVVSRFIVTLLFSIVATSAHAELNQSQEKSANNNTPKLKPYVAQYKLFRSGEEHGTAERELSLEGDNYRLQYQSSLEWMIFSDERYESSQFKVEYGRVKPLEYKMERKGTGPDRSYLVTFDRENRQVISAKKKKRKNDSMVKWNSNWLDPISYQQQLYFDLHAGLEEFNYQFINRKGKEHKYNFKLTGKEQLILPYGTIEAVKLERIYEDSERQTIAWFAPELDYALVRIWKGKAGVEQFDLQLQTLTEQTVN